MLSRLAPLALLPLFALACSSPSESTGTEDGHLDTSGCSGEDTSEVRGPVTVDATRPPESSCWNIAESGLTVSYMWTQANDAKPEKKDVGFYVALGGASTYEKADTYACEQQSSGGYGGNTSGESVYACTATKVLTFGNEPALLEAAYDSSGARTTWSVQVAVSLDDSGDWDSLNGANYRFSL